MEKDPTPSPQREAPSDVHVVTLPDREVLLIGTAHISRESVELVREVIEKERPDCVCVELDTGRFEALSNPQRWESLDLGQIIRKQQLATLFANLLLSSYQKRLGGQLGVTPGSELLEAVRAADELGIRVEFCDRDIRATLRRAWRALSWLKKFTLMSTLIASVFERPEVSEEDLRKLRERDTLNEMMQEIGRAMPALKRVLIDERDHYLAQRILESDGEKLVAVVGAGHVEGMRERLIAQDEADLEELSRIPPPSGAWKWVGWGIPAAIMASLVLIGLRHGLAAAGENALFWFLANAIPCSLGGALALGHPVTVAVAFLAAPFTSLTPVVGAGHVSALVQTLIRPPVVREFRSVGDDISSLSGWWNSRLLRIFLVFVLTTLGSFLGTWVGGARIFSNLF